MFALDYISYLLTISTILLRSLGPKWPLLWIISYCLLIQLLGGDKGTFLYLLLLQLLTFLVDVNSSSTLTIC
jgi:hypothetical protein